MALPELDVAALAKFKGKDDLFFGFFASEAIDQAAFLVKEIAGVQDVPDEDERGQKLYTYAVLDLAFQLYTEQEYADINVNPFQSEQIGSYSYSKSAAASKILGGDLSDQIWLKLLQNYAENLSDATQDVQYGGIDPDFSGIVQTGNGKYRLLGPRKDIEFFDNVYGNEYPNYGPPM